MTGSPSNPGRFSCCNVATCVPSLVGETEPEPHIPGIVVVAIFEAVCGRDDVVVREESRKGSCLPQLDKCDCSASARRYLRDEVGLGSIRSEGQLSLGIGAPARHDLIEAVPSGGGCP